GEIVGVSVGPKGTYFIQSDMTTPTPTSHVKRIDSEGRVKTVSKDLWAYETAKNPDGRKVYGFTDLNKRCAADLAAFEKDNAAAELPPLSKYRGIIESHGYQTTVHHGDVYVADAAANAILQVDEHSGRIRTVAVIPATPITFSADIAAMLEEATGLDLPDCLAGARFVPEPVPTDVKVGKDGTLYVSTLQGWLGEPLPLSSVWRVDAKSGKAAKVASGMHGATGLDLIGEDIFVAEMFGGEVSVIKNGKGRVRTLFTLPEAADVSTKGSTIYASAGVFAAPGSIVSYKYTR
ncbi:MAG TPA: ScyD/ScyE family protein, partial [Ornithinibacter sp.]|nr:ScyD/ScyE family protein [Ornithinibacter sp.]